MSLGNRLTLQPVQTRSDRRAFYNFAWKVYRHDPYWVPHLWPQRKAYLERKTAFFTFGEGEFWLARRGSEVAGTLGTAINHSRNHDRDEKAAIFGFFEVLPDDQQTAFELWDHACGWARQHGMTDLQGPYSFSPNEENGFLVQGHQSMPAIMMGHTPANYAVFAERYGFQKLGDALAYRFDLSSIDFDVDKGPAIIHRIAERSRQRHGSQAIRNPDMRHWDAEILRLHALYNSALRVLPEFSPMELVDFRLQAEGLRSIIDPELVFIAEVDGQPAGFALGLPNMMEALKHANGLRYPWDYLRFLQARKHITSASFKILAIDPGYWGRGLEAQMFLEMARAVIRKGYTWVDGSLTGEQNPQTNKLAERMGAYVYRRYREVTLHL